MEWWTSSIFGSLLFFCVLLGTNNFYLASAAFVVISFFGVCVKYIVVELQSVQRHISAIDIKIK